MPNNIAYTRRDGDHLQTTTRIAELFHDWRGADECWLFVSPHDDDVVTGAGLLFQVGIAEGAKVHAAVVTDGRMGYCRLEQRGTIADVRRAETQRSFEILGLPPDRLRFLGYPDGRLSAFAGSYFIGIGSAMQSEEPTGLQISFSRLLREVRPNRVFLATSSDLHPDHRATHEEFLISLFHAQGRIWPELGEPIAEIPQVYEFAVYCDFPEPPQIRLDTPPEMLQVKLDAIRAYASQEQIGAIVEIQRAVGPIEYLRELKFKFYSPQQYHKMFGRG